MPRPKRIVSVALVGLMQGQPTSALYAMAEQIRAEIRARFDKTRCEYMARIKAEKALRAARKTKANQ